MTDSLLTMDTTDQVDPNKDYLSELVGDGKKFKDTRELAKSKAHADSLIKLHETQMDQMREEMEKLRDENMAKAKLTDLLDQWQNREKAPPQKKTKDEDKSPSMDTKQIESLIDTRLQDREQSRKQTDNYNFVKTKLIEQHGREYDKALSQQMSDLGIDEKYLNDMARNAPKALLKMLGIDENPPVRDPFRAPPRSQMNQNQYKPLTQERTWDWYQKLKEANPKKYYTRETNVQMHKDALSLGDRFEDGDFNRFAKDYRISY